MKHSRKKMQQNPLISIITINLNNAAGLRSTLQSLAGQTWKNFESIIVDGGSTDGSVEVIKEFSEQKTFHISKWVSEKDDGLYHAQNKGIRVAKGNYLLFLNSGDYLASKDTLAKLEPEAWQADIVYGDIYIKHRFRKVRTKLPSTITPEHLYYSSLMHPASFIRRDMFQKIGMYREDFKICSDYYFFVKAILRHRATLFHTAQAISVFPAGGISTRKKYRELQKRERSITIAEFFSTEFLSKKAIDLEERMNSLRFAVLAIPRFAARQILKLLS